MRWILFFLFLGLQLSAQELSLRKGMVIDSIPVNDTINESFSIYLPMSYSNEVQLPVLFIFDSEGRGKKAAQLFKSAADEQQYILASSNDLSPQKTFEENVLVASRLMNAVTTRIPVDFNSVSVAGFSEGARVANSIPLIFNNIHGVIAVGGRLLNTDYLEKGNRFVFVGISGDEEFSSYGMHASAALLDRMGFPSQVYLFDGGHTWPNPEILASGLATLTLEAMKRNKRPLNPAMVNTLYEKDLAMVNRMLSNGEAYKGYSLLEQLQSKYEGLRDTRQLRELQRQVRRSRNFAEQQRELERVQEKESRLIDDFIYYFNEDVATANFENLGWWNYQKLQLEALAGGDNEAEADMAQRLLGMLNELARSKRAELEAAPNASLEARLLANMLQTIFDPENFEAYKRVISLSARDGDYDTALFYLEEMLKHGYENMDELYELEGTLALRMTYDYNWLIKKYLGSSRYYDVTDQ